MLDHLFYFNADEPQGGSDQSQAQPSSSGGWKRPANQSGGSSWRKSDAPPARPSAASVTNRWRPSAESATESTGESSWRKPRPGETTYKPAEPPAAEVDTEPEVQVEAEAEADEIVEPVLPFGDDTGAALPLIEDEDDETFSMSELIALASLADRSSGGTPVQQTTTPETAAPITDPAEYARRALAELQAQPAEEDDAVEVAAAASAAASIGQMPTADDPAEYARRALAELQGQSGVQAEPAASAFGGTSALTPAQEELATRFRTAETNVRSLRERYRAGLMTREQLQTELRSQMVLDESQVWWMLGVETDTWYRYENGAWVAAVPAVLAAQAPQAGAASALDQDFGDRTVPTTPVTDQGFIPKQVPMTDPDYTIPGAGAVFMNDPASQATVPVNPYTNPTVPMQPVSDVTQVNPAVAVDYQANYNYVPSPAVPTAPPYQPGAAPSGGAADQVKADERRRTLSTGVLIAAALIGIAFLVLAGIIIIGVLYYNSLASPWQDEIAALANYTPQFQTARILAADGSVIAELNSRSGGARTSLPLEQISPYMIHAVVATENERFYDDPGWDLVAITRAFLQNITAGDIQSGASTITQQIARSLVLQDTTVSAERKLQEIIIAAEIARRYDKNFILELYLNEIFFGNQSYGVEAASQFYFGHSAESLNLPEAAMLAGLIQAPARYDPVINRSAAFERMNIVMDLMAQVGCLQFQHTPYNGAQPFCVTQQDLRSGQVVLDKARVEAANYVPRTYQVRYPHFINYIQTIVEQSFGTDEMFRRGFTIYTTLDPRVQDVAQAALVQQVQQNAFTGINTGAVMVTDPRDGTIRAMVGSPNFRDDSIDGQVNNVFTWQQPGSSIKPILYTAALEGYDTVQGRAYFTPATILWDVPTRYTNPDYEPVNFDRRFRGPEAVRYALQNSLNIPAVKTMAAIGTAAFQSAAERMGLRFLPEATFGLPSALGANEVRLYDMVQAYGTLANTGLRVPLYSITRITAADGEEIALPARAAPGQVVQAPVAYLMQNIMSDNNARADVFGLNSGLTVEGYPGLVGAKTGTSNDNRDLWTLGFTNNAVVGVWMGRVDNGVTNGATQTTAVPLWNTVMQAALQNRQPQAFTNPGGVVEQTICNDTGTLYDPNIQCASVRNELFIQTQPPPPANASFLQTIAIDTWTGYRANQYCPENVTTATFANISDPTAIAWLNTPDGQVYAQTVGIELPVQAPPEGECTAGMTLPQVAITSPANGAPNVSGILQINGTVSAPNFNRYQLEIASLNTPDQYSLFAGPFGNQVNNGVLGQLDTTQLTNGLYRIRLSVYSNNTGGYEGSIFREVQIGVNNVAPTAQPTIPIIPTFPPDATVLPQDFSAQAGATNTVIPLGGLSIIATPTATVIVGG